MLIKITVRKLLESSDALKRLGEKGVKALGMKPFYSVSKNLGQVHPEIEEYNKAYQAALKEYSEEQKDGTVKIPDKYAFEFNAAIDEAQLTEVEIEVRKIVLTEELIEKGEIKAVDMFALEWMFELPPDPGE
jgi:hypothetical protein